MTIGKKNQIPILGRMRVQGQSGLQSEFQISPGYRVRPTKGKERGRERRRKGGREKGREKGGMWEENSSLQ